MRIGVEPRHAHEVPEHLIKQKKTWDAEQFYGRAMSVNGWEAYVFFDSDTDAEIGVMLCSFDRLFNRIAIDTLIIDELLRHRVTVLREVIRVATDTAVSLARGYGATSIAWETENPGVYERWLAELHPVRETTVMRVEVN